MMDRRCQGNAEMNDYENVRKRVELADNLQINEQITLIWELLPKNPQQCITKGVYLPFARRLFVHLMGKGAVTPAEMQETIKKDWETDSGGVPRGMQGRQGVRGAGLSYRGGQNGADGRACAWEAATIKGMAWPASPVSTGCQGNPCSTGIRWGVSPAAQMGCLRNRSGSPSGADQP